MLKTFLFISLCWLTASFNLFSNCYSPMSEKGLKATLAFVPAELKNDIFTSDFLAVANNNTSDEFRFIENIQEYYHHTYSVELLFIGAISLLTLFMLLLFLRSRDRIYFYYFLFLLFSLFVAIINQMDYQWEEAMFYSQTPFAHRSLEAVTLLALFAYCLFTLKLLDVKKHDPKLAKWIISLAALTSVYGCLYFFLHPLLIGYESVFFFTSRAIILPMSLIAIIWVSYKTHSVFKSYFIIGSTFYFTGAFLAVLREADSFTIPIPYLYQVDPDVYFLAGIFLETICFTLALTHRIFLLYKEEQKREEKIRQKAISERDLAIAQVLTSRSQSNPHFIFNSLSAIKYLIQSHQNEKAIKSLTSYSRFIRSLLDTGVQPEIPLSEELKIAREYLQIESNRFDDSFTFHIDTSVEVDTDAIYLPPLILLPFLEKAIWKDLEEQESSPKGLYVNTRKTDKDTVIIIARGERKYTYSMQEIMDLQQESNLINNERIALYNKNHNGEILCYMKPDFVKATTESDIRTVIAIRKK